MRFYVLGVGAVGTLLSFHLKRTARNLAQNPLRYLPSLPNPSARKHLPAPSNLGVILRLRKSNYAKSLARNDGVVLEKDGVQDLERGFGIEWLSTLQRVGGPLEANIAASLARRKNELDYADDPSEICVPGISEVEKLGYPPGSIDALIVTTKAQNTLAAIKPLAPYITPASTIVLLQNGQGVLDLLLEELFPDPARRPHFILANTTHGVWTRNRLHAVHAAQGQVQLGVVPSPTLGRSYERILPFPETEEDGHIYSSASRIKHNTFTPPPLLDLDALPSTPDTETLLKTLSMLLCLPLDVTWQPIRKYQLMSLRKLAVNACINPLTALISCRNGELYGNTHAERTIKEVCSEVGAILEALAKRAYHEGLDRIEHEGQLDTFVNPLASTRDFLYTPSTLIGDQASSGSPALDPSLSRAALFAEVQRVIRSTAPNYSSMYQDLHKGSGSTEINFINGYIGKMGRSLHIPTPVNDTLTNLIRLRSSQR